MNVCFYYPGLKLWSSVWTTCVDNLNPSYRVHLKSPENAKQGPTHACLVLFLRLEFCVRFYFKTTLQNLKPLYLSCSRHHQQITKRFSLINPKRAAISKSDFIWIEHFLNFRRYSCFQLLVTEWLKDDECSSTKPKSGLFTRYSLAFSAGPIFSVPLKFYCLWTSSLPINFSQLYLSDVSTYIRHLSTDPLLSSTKAYRE